MYDDYEFWRYPPPGAAPDANVRELFRSFLKGNNILLLGSTKMLLELATDAYDLYPKWDNPIIQDRDWRTLDKDYDTIIGCGPFNFTQELTDELFPIFQKHCSRLVLRIIRKPTWEPKYAKFFPEPEYFSVVPQVYHDTGSHRFYVWDFK